MVVVAESTEESILDQHNATGIGSQTHS